MDLVKLCEPSSSTQEDLPIVPDSFRTPRFRAVWRPMASDFFDCQMNTTFRRRSYVHDFPNRKQRLALRRRMLLQKLGRQPPYQLPKWATTVNERSVSPATEESLQNIHKMMTTIKEETFLPKPSSRNNPIRKVKDLEDKVAALKLVVSRLHKMCLEKPETVESTLPEETIQQFKNIHL